MKSVFLFCGPYVKPTRHVMHQQVSHSTIVRSYVFCNYLRTNSDFCPIHQYLIGFCNIDEKCLLRGTNWVFKWSSLRFVFKRFKKSWGFEILHFDANDKQYRSCGRPKEKKLNYQSMPNIIKIEVVCKTRLADRYGGPISALTLWILCNPYQKCNSSEGFNFV